MIVYLKIINSTTIFIFINLIIRYTGKTWYIDGAILLLRLFIYKVICKWSLNYITVKRLEMEQKLIVIYYVISSILIINFYLIIWNIY